MKNVKKETEPKNDVLVSAHKTRAHKIGGVFAAIFAFLLVLGLCIASFVLGLSWGYLAATVVFVCLTGYMFNVMVLGLYQDTSILLFADRVECTIQDKTTIVVLNDIVKVKRTGGGLVTRLVTRDGGHIDLPYIRGSDQLTEKLLELTSLKFNKF